MEEEDEVVNQAESVETRKDEFAQQQDYDTVHESNTETTKDEVVNPAESGENSTNEQVEDTQPSQMSDVSVTMKLLEGVDPQEEASTSVPIKEVKINDVPVTITILPETEKMIEDVANENHITEIQQCNEPAEDVNSQEIVNKFPVKDENPVNEGKDDLSLAQSGPAVDNEVPKKEDTVLNIECDVESEGQKKEKLLLLIIKSMLEFLNSKNFLAFLLFMAGLATVVFLAHKNQPTAIVFDKELFSQLDNNLSKIDT